MPDVTTALQEPALVGRDGTSQEGRTLPALQPDYAALDEHTLADWLHFAKQYSRELSYVAEDGSRAGDWSGFIDSELSVADVEAFLRDPSRFDPLRSPALFRPHLLLFLVFLKLLARAQKAMNRLTAKHLDFYYRTFLEFTRRPSIADHVNVIVELASGSKQALLPAGTPISAGRDASGRERVYVTDQDRVLNRAQVAALRSLCVLRQRVRLEDLPAQFGADVSGAFLSMLRLALGSNGVLAPFVTASGSSSEINEAFLRQRLKSLQDVPRTYFMTLATLRDLMKRKQARPAPPEEWPAINARLEAAGKVQNNKPDFRIEPESRDFAQNVKRALGEPDYRRLPEVTDLEDVFALSWRSDVQAFITLREPGGLYFGSVADFVAMMQDKARFEQAWAGINAIIEQAGRVAHGSASWRLFPTADADVTAFDSNLKRAINLTAAQKTLESFLREVELLEGYFGLPAETFCALLEEIWPSAGRVNPPNWSEVVRLLLQAHAERQRSRRLQVLRALRGKTPPATFSELLAHVLQRPMQGADDAGLMDAISERLSKRDFARLQSLAVPEDKDKSWDAILPILETAERNRVGDAPPEETTWLNLYPATDATQQFSTHAQRDGQARWLPFGAPPASESPDSPPQAVLGWALASPLLMLSEGERKITLRLTLRGADPALAAATDAETRALFRIDLSTEKGFQCIESTPEAVSVKYAPSASPGSDEGELTLTLRLAAAFPAVTCLPPSSSELRSEWPVLRLMLQPRYRSKHGRAVLPYRELGQALLQAVRLEVEVTGIASLRLESDDGVLSWKKPFEPFGRSPLTGSRLRIGHPELCCKPLDSLSFQFEWMGAPSDLAEHYANYPLRSPPSFKAGVCFVDRSGRTSLLDMDLFAATPPAGGTPRSPQRREVASIPAAARPSAADLWSAEWLQEELSQWPRYLQWELGEPDFQHSVYLSVAQQKAQALLAALAVTPRLSETELKKYEVKPPYLPKLKSLSVGYRCSVSVSLARALAGPERLYHIHPFGFCDVEGERSALGVPLVAGYDREGELYIALRDVDAPQTVSLFFQVAEGSADPDLPPQPVQWSYLSNDRFLPMQKEVLADSTRGLINSGIVELALPAAQPSTRIQGASYVLRVAIEKDRSSVCEIIGLHTQAVSATFVDRGNAAEHFMSPLPADTIRKLSKPLPEIARLRQPYSSYGGRMAERDGLWTTRVSERLRHKGRAIATWDYERLILDRFPEIYKAKCIAARAGNAGHVQIIVIPDIRNKRPFDPFAPKAPINLLTDIREYLAGSTSCWSTIEVRNARYLPVKLRLDVRLRVSGNDAFYAQRLNDDLNRYLSPWAYDEGADIVIGSRIYASSIITFVERRDYVDYVGGVTFYTAADGQQFRPVPLPKADSGDGYFVETSASDQVLVAAQAHEIRVLKGDLYEASAVTGIDFMKIEFDFIVAPNEPPA